MTEKESDLIELEKVKFVKDQCVKAKLLEVTKDIMLYSNLYPIKFTKDINIYEYSFKIEPVAHEENVILKIFRDASKYLFNTYGYYYRSGPTFFAVKEVKEVKQFKVSIYNKGKSEYTLTVNGRGHHSKIEKGQTHGFEEIDEKVIFLIIREILQANPNVHFDRDNLYLENKKKEVRGENNKYFVHDGYKISIQQTDIGICLIIGIKNKIKGQFTVYDMLKNNPNNIEDLVGRRFIPFEGSRHQQIFKIDKDRNPINTNRNHNQHSYTYYNYYKVVLDIEIKDKKQPLIVVVNPKKFLGNPKDLDNKNMIIAAEKGPIKYYVPELCTLIGINDEDNENRNFREDIIEKTRLEPDKQIKQIEACLTLFYDKTEKKTYPKIVEKDGKKIENLNNIINDECNTSDKKRLEYGIEIEKLSTPVRPYYIRQPTFNNGKNNKLTIKDISRVIPVGRGNMDTDEWICLYAQKEEKISYKLLDGFIKCAKGYGIRFKNNDSNWIPMSSQNPKVWINTVESELKSRKTCKFVIFLLSKHMNDLYIPLKNHSFCEKGYISQVIKVESIIRAMKSKRGPDSYYSKILLQINNKIGGFNYFLNVDSYINNLKIMLIGIDTSHIWARKNKELEERTGIAMVATKDKNFSKFYSKQEILVGDVHYASEATRIISSFIKEAYAKYVKENKHPPENIIIYRQGIAYNQLIYVEIEVKLIREICKELNLHYYYVNVNTRVTTKLFEYNSIKDSINKGNHKNPEQGLVILDQITNYKKFEFYIQPQKVTLGSATPTYFHVPYGNMNFPELLIQLTYWTTYLYSNWQNAVRVPHVIKMAEKLAYIVAKQTKKEFNENLSDKQAFL